MSLEGLTGQPHSWVHLLYTMYTLGLPTSGLLLHGQKIIYFIYTAVILDFLLYVAKIYLGDTPGTFCTRAAPLSYRLLWKSK